MSSVNSDLKDEITGHAVSLNRLEAGMRKDVVKELKVLERKLTKQLDNSNVLNGKPMTKFRQKRLRELLKQTKETINQHYKEIENRLDNDLASVAGVVEAQTVKAVNTSIKASVLSTGMSKQALRAIASNTLIEGAPSKEWWARRGTAFVDKFSDTVRQGMLSGETTPQIVRKLRGSRDLQYKDGLLQGNYRSAEALVRTSVQSVANSARVETYRENDDIVKGIEWSATFDNRTSQICANLDGKQWDLDYNPIGHGTPYPGDTAHWNCRSTTVSVLKSWKELGAKGKFKEIPESTKASMDGQVSGKQNYETWLGKQSKATQEDVLGKGKRKLWKEGKVGFSDLVDQSANPLTLGQIKNKLSMVDDVVFDVPYVNLEKSYDVARSHIQEVNGERFIGKATELAQPVTASKNMLINLQVTGFVSEDLAKQATKALGSDKVKVHMAFKTTSLKKAIRDKEIKNSLQSGKGSYKTHGKERISLEKRVLGLDDFDAENVSHYPKYGFMASKDKFDFDKIFDYDYGDNVVVFKDTIRKRTTVTMGDSFNGNDLSLGGATPPSPLNKINEESFYRTFRYTEGKDYQPFTYMFDDADKFMKSGHYKDLVKTTRAEYIEAQIYGELDLEDIDYIMTKTEGAKKAIESELRKAGVDIKVKLYE